MFSKCVVVPINRSDLSFESSISAIFRSYELIAPDAYFILYAKFNSVTLKKIKELIYDNDKPIFPNVRILEKEITSDNLSEINEIKNQCEKIYLVPSSGANITALYMGKLNDYPKISFKFAFGPWQDYYYPFTPRLTENFKVIDGEDLKEAQSLQSIKLALENKIEDLVKGNQFLKEMYKLSLELNSINIEKSTFDILVLENDTVKVKIQDSDFLKSSSIESKLRKIINDTQEENYFEKSKNFKQKDDFIKKILKLIGIYPIVVYQNEQWLRRYNRSNFPLSATDQNKLELREVVERADLVLVDTNLFYFGIHTYEIKNLAVPQCVINEIERRWFQDKEDWSDVFSNFLYDIFKAKLRKTKIIPTELTICDTAIPKIDPTLIENAVILSGDKKCIRNWKYLPLKEYTKIMYANVDDSRVKDMEHERAFFELSLAIFLKRYFEGNEEIKIKVCYKDNSNNCITLTDEK